MAAEKQAKTVGKKVAVSKVAAKGAKKSAPAKVAVKKVAPPSGKSPLASPPSTPVRPVATWPFTTPVIGKSS